jgi:beta-lactamase class A
LLSALILFLASGAPQAESRAALEARFAEIARTAGGTVGVSALHLESGTGASLHGRERFPIASVFKLPVAVELLVRVDRGTVRLDQLVAIGPADVHPGGGRTIAERAPRVGISLSIRELLEAMLVESDNTAADLLLPLAGGPEAITAQLDESGLGDIRIDRSEAELWFDSFGVSPHPPRAQWTLENIRGATREVPEAERRAAAERFLADPRDTATPDALVQLLRQIQERRRLSPEKQALLLALMERTHPGEKRLRAGFPADTRVAHRTGTGADVGGLNIVTDDVGIVTLPGRRGHLAIAVMIKGSDRPIEAREQAIARIARAARDYWTR